MQKIGEWTFTIHKEPVPGMVLARPGQTITFSHAELVRLWETPIVLLRYELPTYIQWRVVKKGAEALGKWIEDEDAKKRVPPPYRKPRGFVIPEKPKWKKDIEETERKLEETYKRIKEIRKWLDDVVEIKKMMEEVE